MRTRSKRPSGFLSAALCCSTSRSARWFADHAPHRRHALRLATETGRRSACPNDSQPPSSLRFCRRRRYVAKFAVALSSRMSDVAAESSATTARRARLRCASRSNSLSQPADGTMIAATLPTADCRRNVNNLSARSTCSSARPEQVTEVSTWPEDTMDSPSSPISWTRPCGDRGDEYSLNVTMLLAATLNQTAIRAVQADNVHHPVAGWRQVMVFRLAPSCRGGSQSIIIYRSTEGPRHALVAVLHPARIFSSGPKSCNPAHCVRVPQTPARYIAIPATRDIRARVSKSFDQ